MVPESLFTSGPHLGERCDLKINFGPPTLKRCVKCPKAGKEPWCSPPSKVAAFLQTTDVLTQTELSCPRLFFLAQVLPDPDRQHLVQQLKNEPGQDALPGF